MARRRIAFLQNLAADLRGSARRHSRRSPAARAPDERTAAQLERRLDETRARLQREIPPRDDDPAR